MRMPVHEKEMPTIETKAKKSSHHNFLRFARKKRRNKVASMAIGIPTNAMTVHMHTY
jgi:hypothetical protein